MIISVKVFRNSVMVSFLSFASLKAFSASFVFNDQGFTRRFKKPLCSDFV